MGFSSDFYYRLRCHSWIPGISPLRRFLIFYFFNQSTAFLEHFHFQWPQTIFVHTSKSATYLGVQSSQSPLSNKLHIPSTMGMLHLFFHSSFLVSRFLGPKRNSLPELPVQVLFRITEFLSRDDITCTSLCNHRLFALLKIKEPPSLRTRRDKLALLTRPGTRSPKVLRLLCLPCSP